MTHKPPHFVARFLVALGNQLILGLAPGAPTLVNVAKGLDFLLLRSRDLIL